MERILLKVLNLLKEQQLFHRGHHINCAASPTERANVSTSVVNVLSRTKLRIVMSCTLARPQRAGEHLIKGELEEIRRETEVREITEVRREVVTDELIEVGIDEVSHPNMVGETNHLAPLETELKEYTEEIENLQVKTTLIKRGKSWKGSLKS